jgi:hypothetical protein
MSPRRFAMPRATSIVAASHRRHGICTLGLTAFSEGILLKDRKLTGEGPLQKALRRFPNRVGTCWLKKHP